MKINNYAVFGALALSMSACSTSMQTVADASPIETFAIVDVSIIPMDRERVLSHQTLVISKGAISEMGPSEKTAIPDEASKIDGRGLFLMPGFYDLHVHQERDEEFLFYLSNGVTTIVNLHGNEAILNRRAAIAAGEIIAPRLVTCGPPLQGAELDKDGALDMIRAISIAGYDCVKIRETWDQEAYIAIANAVTNTGLLFMGHAPRGLPFSSVIKDGRQRIVHIEDIVYTTKLLDDWLRQFEAKNNDPPHDPNPRESLREVVADTARQLAENGIWVIPTQLAIDNYLKRSSPEGRAALAARPYLKYLDPFTRRRWADSARTDYARFEAQVALEYYMLKVFHDSGVPIAAGTDSSIDSRLNIMPGWGLHEELAILTKTGFSPFEALQTATSKAAAYLGKSDEGVIAPGNRADFILLKDNPLENLAHAREPVAVVTAGRWFHRNEFADQLEALKSTYAKLESELAPIERALESSDPLEWLKAYQTLENPSPEIAAYLESKLNDYGYELLYEDGFIDESIIVFQAGVEAFPQSANAYDSLAEAYLAKGDKERAILLYKKALEVDPELENAKGMLKQLDQE